MKVEVTSTADCDSNAMADMDFCNFLLDLDCESDDSVNSTVDVQKERLTTSQLKLLRYERHVAHRRVKRTEEHRRRRVKLRDTAEAKRTPLQVPVTSGQSVCIDLSFANAMSAKERCKLVRQLGRVWSLQKIAERPVALTIAGLEGDSEFASECRRMCSGFDGFKWLRDDRPVEELFPVSRIVYLCPDATAEPLLELDDRLVYVIGGLVDESGRGALSLRRATEMGAVCRRLPIDELMQRSGSGTFSTTLAINQVFQALLLFYETNDWRQTLTAIVPRRSGFVLRNP